MRRIGQNNEVFCLKKNNKYVYIDGLEIKLSDEKLTMFRIKDLKKAFPLGIHSYQMDNTLPPHSKVTRYPYSLT